MSRCIIACNGPSLNDIDMSLLKDEDVFCLNRGYLKEGLPTTYLVVVNRNVENQWKNEILAVETKKKFSYSLPGTDRLFFTPDVPSFQPDHRKPMWQGHTVTYVALQIAYSLGYKNVGLIGCDHNYPHMDRRLVGVDINHFDPNYFPEGAKWDLPNLPRTELAYKLAKDYYEIHGRNIYNCSTQTKLEVFPRLALKEFLEIK